VEIIARFGGDVADRHLLPTFEGSQSIEGLARAITVITHYATTGDVRRRYPFSDQASVYLEPMRSGSFDTLFSLLTDPNSVLLTPLGQVGVNVGSILIYELLKTLTNRAIGREHTPHNEDISRLVQAKSGDIEALGEAVEPALKKAHTVINNGAGNITLITGHNNIVNLDRRTKDYINSKELDDRIRQLLVSVGMLNVNTRNGRVYNFQLHRTVPIYVVKDADSRTLPNLAHSLQLYSSNMYRHGGSEINIEFTTERSLEGEDKRYLVRDAFFTDR
jgi:hypothetical protein